MKIINILKTIILTGAITILISIPVFAQDTQSTQEPTMVSHYTLANGDIQTNYSNNSYYINSDVTIQSKNCIDNSITIAKNDGELYSFYVDKIDSYYLSEAINITMDQNNAIVDCTVDEQPQAYNTTIIYTDNKVSCFRLDNGDVYSFDNETGFSWKTGDKVKVAIQDFNVLEVHSIPIDER